jgi:hypothetical protein
MFARQEIVARVVAMAQPRLVARIAAQAPLVG